MLTKLTLGEKLKDFIVSVNGLRVEIFAKKYYPSIDSLDSWNGHRKDNFVINPPQSLPRQSKGGEEHTFSVYEILTLVPDEQITFSMRMILNCLLSCGIITSET